MIEIKKLGIILFALVSIIANVHAADSINVAQASNGATASGGWSPGSLIDGQTTGYTDSTGYAGALWNRPITITLDKVYPISEIHVLLWDNDSRYYQYKVETSISNAAWTTVVDKTSGRWTSWQKDTFNPINAKYIRITGTYNSVNNGFHAVEMEAYTQTNALISTSATTATPTSSGVELGNWDYCYYSAIIREQQNRPEITWDVIIKKSALQYHRPGVITIYYDAVNPQSNFRMSDVNYIKGRFDKATAEKDLGWDYGVVLLQEEVMTPSKRAEWTWMGASLSTWNIEGEVTLAGVKIQALKPWYIATYGAWDQTWWDNVRINNRFYDSKVKAWSNEYTYNVYRAWHIHMHNLGKKSAVIGPVGIASTDIIGYFDKIYAGGSGTFILDNYDFILQYNYPNKIGCREWDCTDNSLKTVRDLRNYRRTKKIGFILTSEFGNYCGFPWSEAVANDEFNKVAPYVDVIFVRGYYNDLNVNPPRFYPPYLIAFSERYKSGNLLKDNI